MISDSRFWSSSFIKGNIMNKQANKQLPGMDEIENGFMNE